MPAELGRRRARRAASPRRRRAQLRPGDDDAHGRLRRLRRRPQPGLRRRRRGGPAHAPGRSTATRGTVLTYGGAGHHGLLLLHLGRAHRGRPERLRAAAPPRPYLVSVPDPFDRDLARTTSWPDPPSFTARRARPAPGPGRPGDRRWRSCSRGVSPRVGAGARHDALGPQATFSGIELRSALGLRDTWFTVTPRAPPRPARGPPVRRRTALAAARGAAARRRRRSGRGRPPRGRPDPPALPGDARHGRRGPHGRARHRHRDLPGHGHRRAARAPTGPAAR